MAEIQSHNNQSIPDKENYKNSPWFKQDSFSKAEMTIQPMISIFIAIHLFFKVGLKKGILSFLIKQTPTPLQFIWGHGPKCICLTFWLFVVCLMVACLIKWVIYQIIGFIFGMQPLSPLDDFWLYDFPINRLNVPTTCIFNKPKDKSPEQMLQ